MPSAEAMTTGPVPAEEDPERRLAALLREGASADEALDAALALRQRAGVSFGWLFPQLFARVTLERSERLPELAALAEPLYRELDDELTRGPAAQALAALLPDSDEAFERVFTALQRALRSTEQITSANQIIGAIAGFQSRAADAAARLAALSATNPDCLWRIVATLVELGPETKRALPELALPIGYLRSTRSRGSELRQRIESDLRRIEQSGATSEGPLSPPARRAGSRPISRRSPCAAGAGCRADSVLERHNDCAGAGSRPGCKAGVERALDGCQRARTFDQEHR